jgi:hypothetical protein
MGLRRPTEAELRLLRSLVEKSSTADLRLPSDWAERLQVESMDDGGMGSLRLWPAESIGQVRQMGSRASELQLQDSDGVAVILSLNIDQHGRLFELDVWKTDFGPVKEPLQTK